MKRKLALIGMIALMQCSIGFAQKKTKPSFSYCNDNKNVVKISELGSCPLTSKKDATLKVKSFVLTYVVKGVAHQKMVEGNVMPADLYQEIKTAGNTIDKIMIDDIITTKDGAETKQPDALEFTVKKSKVIRATF